jgi:hypothetical protein
MKRIEVKIVGMEAANAAVLKLPWRMFPALALQGDSLAILTALADDLLSALAEGRLEDARGEAAEISEVLHGYRRAYEEAMRDAGLELPYPKR